jgi:hypothetical protein
MRLAITRGRPWALMGALGLATALLAGCGGGSDDGPTGGGGGGGGGTGPTATLTGVAATGAAIPNAVVTGVNARGQTVTVSTGGDGSFTIAIPEGAPYGLKVTDAAGNTWYSFAPAAGRANITPLTTLALSQAAGNKPLADVLTAWASQAPTADQVLAAAAVVNANLQAVMRGKGVDPATLNPFTADFSANGQGLDAVLDAMRVRFDCTATACTQTINGPAGELLVTWNASISTTGFTLSWSGGGQVDVNLGACRPNPTPGTYSMVVSTTVSGLGGVPIPDICVDGLPAKPASQSEFCGAADVNAALPPGVSITSCTFDGTVGTISARITNPIVIDYTVKYTFVRR